MAAAEATVVRPFDVVVYGATGFTGGLLCEYLSRKLSAGLERFTFAIAGRNECPRCWRRSPTSPAESAPRRGFRPHRDRESMVGW